MPKIRHSRNKEKKNLGTPNGRPQFNRKSKDDNSIAYIGIAATVLLIGGIIYMIVLGDPVNYDNSGAKGEVDIAKKLREEREKEKQKALALIEAEAAQIKFEKQEENRLAEEKKQRENEKQKKIQEEKERLLAKKQEEEEKKRIEEEAQQIKLPSQFEFLPTTSISNQTKIEILCKKLIDLNSRESDSSARELKTLGVEAIPCLINAFRKIDVVSEEGRIQGNLVAQTLRDISEKDIEYEAFGSPSARKSAQRQWVEWWNEERKKYEK
jgi:hypothetical protein